MDSWHPVAQMARAAVTTLQSAVTRC